jgi:hypothetical protein
MITVAVTALVLGFIFAAVGLLPSIYGTAFVISAGCFLYILVQRARGKKVS